MKENPTIHQAARVALAAMAVLFVGSIYYYKERALFGDGSFMVFNIVNYESMNIQWNRYGSAVTQLLPFLAVKLHLSVNTVLIAYGFSFHLFYLIATAVCYRYKQYTLAILAALYYHCFFTSSYFWVSEVPQAVAWVFLFFAFVLSSKERRVPMYVVYPVSFVLLFFAISTHFVAIIPLTYLWLFYIIDKKDWTYSKSATIGLSALPILIILLRFMMVGPESGESSQLYGVTHFSIKDLLLTFITPVTSIFALRCLTIYLPSTIILLISIVTVVKHKRISVLIWTMLSLIGYINIMGLTYGKHDSSFPLFHIESEWGPIVIIMATPFVFYFLPKLKSSYAVTLLLVVFLVRIGYIIAAAPTFTARTKFKEQVLTQMRRKGITKLAIYKDPRIQEKLLIDWALPEESLLLSATDGDKPQLSFRFVNKNDKDLIKQLQEGNGISFEFVHLTAKGMNDTYFLTDTTGGYTVLQYSELFE